MGLGDICAHEVHSPPAVPHTRTVSGCCPMPHVSVLICVPRLDSEEDSTVQARAATASAQAGSDSPSCAANEQALVVRDEGQSCSITAIAELVSAAHALAMRLCPTLPCSQLCKSSLLIYLVRVVTVLPQHHGFTLLGPDQNSKLGITSHESSWQSASHAWDIAHVQSAMALHSVCERPDPPEGRRCRACCGYSQVEETGHRDTRIAGQVQETNPVQKGLARDTVAACAEVQRLRAELWVGTCPRGPCACSVHHALQGH